MAEDGFIVAPSLHLVQRAWCQDCLLSLPDAANDLRYNLPDGVVVSSFDAHLGYTNILTICPYKTLHLCVLHEMSSFYVRSPMGNRPSCSAPVWSRHLIHSRRNFMLQFPMSPSASSSLCLAQHALNALFTQSRHDDMLSRERAKEGGHLFEIVTTEIVTYRFPKTALVEGVPGLLDGNLFACG